MTWELQEIFFLTGVARYQSQQYCEIYMQYVAKLYSLLANFDEFPRLK